MSMTKQLAKRLPGMTAAQLEAEVQALRACREAERNPMRRSSITQRLSMVREEQRIRAFSELDEVAAVRKI